MNPLKSFIFSICMAATTFAQTKPVTITGNVKLGTAPAANVTVYADVPNLGKPGNGLPWAVTDVSGNYSLSIPTAVNDVPIRQVLPIGISQVSPADGKGVHVTAANGGTATASFVDTAATAPVAPLAPAPTPPSAVPSTPSAPPATAAFIFGVNPGPAPSAAVAAPACRHFGMTIVRNWTTCGFTSPPPASQWAMFQSYAQAGFTNVAVLNFQNSNPRCKSPAMADWIKFLSAIPPPAQTGVTYFEIGNELDYAAYWTDTPEAYAALLKACYPILHAKGYLVIAVNPAFGMDFLQDIDRSGAIPFCDYVGRHAYEANAAASLAKYVELIAFAKAHGKPIFCTEVGLHGNAKDLPSWSAETQKLYAGIKALGGIYLQFPLYPTGTTASPQSLLLGNGRANQPFYGAAEAGLGVNR